VLPDPATRPIEYLSAFSLPRWLAQRWAERYPWDECLRLGFWYAGPASLWLRVNPLRTGRDALLSALRQADIAAEPGEHPQAVRLEESASIRELPGYAEGWFTVQDQSAMRVASALDPRPGWRVLDMCSAPGGKTTHLAELMRNDGEVIACDADADRLKTVNELCGRLGIGIVRTRHLANEEPPAGSFDAVLVDVPCSNTGVLGRRPEVRWRLTPGDFAHLVRLQTKLLLWAGERVRPGGVVVYSTCSIEPEENGGVVRAALRGLPEMQLEAEEEQVPGRPADGGYWARLRKRQ
jgi:16S rRNA (cytosine967-C5)-methyltransferase